MPNTARVSVILSESDEISRQIVREVEQSESYVEKYDTQVTLADGAADVELAPPQMLTSKLLLLTAVQAVGVKLNSAANPSLGDVKLLLLDTTGLSKLYLSNSNGVVVSVRVHLYGDA